MNVAAANAIFLKKTKTTIPTCKVLIQKNIKKQKRGQVSLIKNTLCTAARLVNNPTIICFKEDTENYLEGGQGFFEDLCRKIPQLWQSWKHGKSHKKSLYISDILLMRDEKALTLSKNKVKIPEGWYAGGLPREE